MAPQKAQTASPFFTVLPQVTHFIEMNPARASGAFTFDGRAGGSWPRHQTAPFSMLQFSHSTCRRKVPPRNNSTGSDGIASHTRRQIDKFLSRRWGERNHRRGRQIVRILERQILKDVFSPAPLGLGPFPFLLF